MSLLLFKREFVEPIRAGSKTTTLRRWASPRVRVGKRAFAAGVGWLMIESVEQIDLKSLPDRDAKSDGFTSRRVMFARLRSLYPECGNDGMNWYRVRFRVDELLTN